MEVEMALPDVVTREPEEVPGVSCFLRDGRAPRLHGADPTFTD